MNFPKKLYVRRLGSSLYVTIPADYARDNGIHPGDVVHWLPETATNDVRLKIFGDAPASPPGPLSAVAVEAHDAR
jgi:hypothetical protein